MPESYDAAIFYAHVRDDPFPGRLTQQQVDGMNAFLEYWESSPLTDRRWLAYCLGTQPIETAWTMQPVREHGRGAGRPYGRADPQTGHAYFGRGYVQLTWRENYAKASEGLRELDVADLDLVESPDDALDPSIAAAIMAHGMAEGWFTSHKLGDYFNAERTDWTGARRIVNGTDRAEEIAEHARAFHRALTAAVTAEEPAQAGPPEEAPEALEADEITAQLVARLKARTGAKEVRLIL